MTYEYEGKTEKEAIEKAAAELGLEKDQFDVEILESQKKTLFKNGYVKIRVHTVDSKNQVSPEFDGKVPNATTRANDPSLVSNPLPQDEVEEKIIDFVKTLIEKMGYEAAVEIMFREEKKIGINVYAGHLGREDLRIILDTENYRIRREESLVRLAYVTADKVRQKKTSILLEPMNPFERRLIHTTLNDIADVETKSEGEGLYKQVRVIYKGVR